MSSQVKSNGRSKNVEPFSFNNDEQEEEEEDYDESQDTDSNDVSARNESEDPAIEELVTASSISNTVCHNQSKFAMKKNR
ncbi:hypothetical protein M9Y10_030628 [Tritrichomonas musculus]|uniref:Uncharacterized protein n=1 Tax=Tritrichomonas musculus TaxID=1915356 RepID=A0ABR2H2J0_9EUKA